MQELKPGTLLQGGKYRIERTLGQGGFGITYLAVQDILERKVAIKEFFFKEWCDRQKDGNTVTLGTESTREDVARFKAKFEKEAKTLSHLSHPNIISIYDIFRENNTVYYVMDYIEGQSLGDLVKKRGALPEAEAVNYIKQVAGALSCIHERSINHLDIKPSNIMLRQSDGKVILIDFGVAKQYDASTKQSTTTTPVGISPGFSPSEQYLRTGVSQFSPESDIYSLGATLYKLLTGNTPPESIELSQTGLPPLPDTVSANCRKTVYRAMKVNKAERPHSVADFMQILEGSEGPAVRSVSEVTVVMQPGGNVPVRPVSPGHPTPPLSQDNPLKKSRKTFIITVIVLASILTAAGVAWGVMTLMSAANDAEYDDTSYDGDESDFDYLTPDSAPVEEDCQADSTVAELDSVATDSMEALQEEPSSDTHYYKDKDGDWLEWTGSVDADGTPSGYGTAVFEDESIGIYVGEYVGDGFSSAIRYDSQWNKVGEIVDGEYIAD